MVLWNENGTYSELYTKQESYKDNGMLSTVEELERILSDIEDCEFKDLSALKLAILKDFSIECDKKYTIRRDMINDLNEAYKLDNKYLKFFCNTILTFQEDYEFILQIDCNKSEKDKDFVIKFIFKIYGNEDGKTVIKFGNEISFRKSYNNFYANNYLLVKHLIRNFVINGIVFIDNIIYSAKELMNKFDYILDNDGEDFIKYMCPKLYTFEYMRKSLEMCDLHNIDNLRYKMYINEKKGDPGLEEIYKNNFKKRFIELFNITPNTYYFIEKFGSSRIIVGEIPFEYELFDRADSRKTFQNHAEKLNLNFKDYDIFRVHIGIPMQMDIGLIKLKDNTVVYPKISKSIKFYFETYNKGTDNYDNFESVFYDGSKETEKEIINKLIPIMNAKNTNKNDLLKKELTSFIRFINKSSIFSFLSEKTIEEYIENLNNNK